MGATVAVLATVQYMWFRDAVVWEDHRARF
jgi:hypothetical protein